MKKIVFLLAISLLLFGCNTPNPPTAQSVTPNPTADAFAQSVTNGSVDQWCSPANAQHFQNYFPASANAQIQVVGSGNFQNHTMCQINVTLTDTDGSDFNAQFYVSNTQICATDGNQTNCQNAQT